MIQGQHPSCLKNTTLNIVASTATVALPTDFVSIRLLERNYSDRTVPLKYNERYDETSYKTTANSTGRYSYRIEGSNIVLEPTPQSSETSGLKITYFYVPDELSADGNSPSIPTLYHNILVESCCVQAKRKEESEGGGGTDIGSFLADLKEQEQLFKEMIERSTLQRVFVQPFGDNY